MKFIIFLLSCFIGSISSVYAQSQLQSQTGTANTSNIISNPPPLSANPDGSKQPNNMQTTVVDENGNLKIVTPLPASKAPPNLMPLRKPLPSQPSDSTGVSRMQNITSTPNIIKPQSITNPINETQTGGAVPPIPSTSTNQFAPPKGLPEQSAPQTPQIPSPANNINQNINQNSPKTNQISQPTGL